MYISATLEQYNAIGLIGIPHDIVVRHIMACHIMGEAHRWTFIG